MKKNKMMRLAAILLVVCLVSTCAISGTFAKYTTSDSASDSARVAKWGVTLQAEGKLYSGAYNATPVKWTNKDATGVSVNAAETGTNVVAPGTSNSAGLKITLTGTPEVSGKVTATLSHENIYLNAGEYAVAVKYGTDGKMDEATYTAIMAATTATDKLYVLNGTSYKLATAWAADNVYYTLEDYVNVASSYYPVIYTMGGAAAGATTSDSLANIAAVFTAILGTGETPAADTTSTTDGKTTLTYSTGKQFYPNDNLSTTFTTLNGKNISWAWAMDGQNDGADTILGDLQAGLTVVKNASGTWSAPVAATGSDAKDYNLETCFELAITVEQNTATETAAS